jgi:hypothetical protein
MGEPKNFRKKEYAFDNIWSTQVFWKVKKNKKGMASRIKPGDGTGGVGICGALSSMWIAKSIQVGKVAAAKDLLDNIHRLTIAQVAYEVGTSTPDPNYRTTRSVEKYLLGMFGLKSTTFIEERDVDDATSAIFLEVRNTPALLSGGGSYYLFNITGCHFMALHLCASVCHLFDCNEGLYSFSGPEILLVSFDKYCAAEYDDEPATAHRATLNGCNSPPARSGAYAAIVSWGSWAGVA